MEHVPTWEVPAVIPASTALTSSLVWPPRAGQPWVCWRCCACWHHCQCYWVPCQPVPLYQCNTSWFLQDSVALESPMAATSPPPSATLVFSDLGRVRSPKLCQMLHGDHTCYTVLQKSQRRTLSAFIHGSCSLKTPTWGTRDSLTVFPESPPTLPRLSHPSSGLLPHDVIWPCAFTYRVVHYAPDYLSPCDGCGLWSSWDPPQHVTTSTWYWEVPLEAPFKWPQLRRKVLCIKTLNYGRWKNWSKIAFLRKKNKTGNSLVQTLEQSEGSTSTQLDSALRQWDQDSGSQLLFLGSTSLALWSGWLVPR